ncbi:hypothetical protein FSP39_008630 [Pinctada imbricata]|uniref:Uncharacterized protein n=1 Tax=Pinctada imbricata TaxID=66713 RepID=A0AA88YI21_PINIB|nr:hypothetical protein FSP39_008630 [Pinctada imbricata]
MNPHTRRTSPPIRGGSRARHFGILNLGDQNSRNFPVPVTKDLVTRISRGFARTTASRFESTAPSNEFFGKSNSHTSRVQIDSICKKVGRNHHRSMDFRCSPTGLKTCVSKPSYTNWNKGNICSERCSKSFLLEEVESLLGKQAIELVPPGQEGQGFYSTFFLVQKKDGGYRPILNLRPLNKYLKVQHFKMETLRSIIQALEKGDWVASLDLKDAYLHVPVFPPHRKFLRFCINNRHYQFRSMPFGLAIAPRIFTKIVTTIGGYLRMKEIYIYMYLDDWLIKSREPIGLLSHLVTTLHKLIDLGLVVNLEKSHLNPSQKITYLGARFNLQMGIVCPTEERYTNLCQTISTITQQAFVPARSFLRILGLMASCIDLVPLARLHMRPIQLYLLCHWSPRQDDISHLVQIKDSLKPHLAWWTQGSNIFRGAVLEQRLPDYTMWTDASNQGWGAHMGNQSVSGIWTLSDKAKHINFLEMLAVQKALAHFRNPLIGKLLMIRSDNSTVVSYINRLSSVVHVGVDNLSMVHEMEHSDQSSSHSGQEKCTGRQFVSRECESENNRVEPVSNSSRSALQHLYKTKHRLVCNKRKSQNSDILLPVPGARSLELRRSGVQLDGDLCICVSPNHINPKDTSENETGDVYTPTDCAAISEAVMVSNTSKSARGDTNDVTFKRGFIKSKKGSNKTSRPSKSQISSLENIKQCGSPKKISKKAESFITNSRRQSTRKVYDARLTIYRNWCASRNVCPYTISVTDLAEFFIYLHEVRGLKASTISGYKSAIASIHKGSCDLKYLTWKTVFLVAMATASRVSEIHALSIDSQHMRFEKNGIRLLPNLNFLAKTQRLGKPWDPLFVPEFNTYATEARDQLLCPCRALRMYVKRTKTLRNRETALFVTYKQNYHQRASKDSISRWIVSLIRYCVETKGINLTSVRAHDTRRLSTSWALFNGASTEEIVKAAHWANESTFTSFYMRDVPSQEARFARLSILGTLKANQHKKKD